MNWTNCNEELPPPGIKIYAKYIRGRPMLIESDYLIKEYEIRDDYDNNNYWWRLA